MTCFNINLQQGSSFKRVLLLKETRDATRCNNCDDLLHPSFTFNIFGGLYMWKIYNEDFTAKIVNRFIDSQESSIIDTHLGSNWHLLLLEESSNNLFL